VPIAIDGDAGDWDDVATIPLAPACAAPPCEGLLPTAIQLAAGPPTDGDTTLFVRVAFSGPPPATPDLRVVLAIGASPLRPATTGSDRWYDGTRYEKNGFAVTPTGPPYAWRWLADGFEARLDGGGWLPYQGAAQITAGVERQAADGWHAIASLDPVTVCWSWRVYLDPQSCQVPLP
jgi:hypothetical protein